MSTNVKKEITLMNALGCVVKDGAVLLARRNEPLIPKIHGKWELPGGKVEFGEDRRELASARFSKRPV